MLPMTARLSGVLLAGLLAIAVTAPSHGQEAAEFLAELKEFKITDANLGQFLKGLEAEKKANSAALDGLGKGDVSNMSIGSLLKCLPGGNSQPNMVAMGQCGGTLADEKSPQEKASGLDDRVYEGMKQRLWIYFDGSAADRKAQFSAAEVAALEKRKRDLQNYRDQYFSPYPDGGG